MIEQNTRHMTDYFLGAGGITSVAWWPWLHAFNEIAALIALWGGAVLVLIRIYVALMDAKASRRKQNKRRTD